MCVSPGLTAKLCSKTQPQKTANPPRASLFTATNCEAALQYREQILHCWITHFQHIQYIPTYNTN